MTSAQPPECDDIPEASMVLGISSYLMGIGRNTGRSGN